MKKLQLVTLLTMSALMLSGCSEIAQNQSSAEINPINNRSEETETGENAIDSLQTASTEESIPDSTDTLKSETELPDSQQLSTEEQSPNQSAIDLSNVLMVATIREAKVLNGFKTESIGTRAYIEIAKDELKNVTNEQYAEFVDNAVTDSGYNWFTIFCDDGTGITFAGSMGFIAEYGVLDPEGSIAECLGYITLSEDGYVYEAAD